MGIGCGVGEALWADTIAVGDSGKAQDRGSFMVERPYLEGRCCARSSSAVILLRKKGRCAKRKWV